MLPMLLVADRRSSRSRSPSCRRSRSRDRTVWRCVCVWFAVRLGGGEKLSISSPPHPFHFSNILHRMLIFSVKLCWVFYRGDDVLSPYSRTGVAGKCLLEYSSSMDYGAVPCSCLYVLSRVVAIHILVLRKHLKPVFRHRSSSLR